MMNAHAIRKGSMFAVLVLSLAVAAGAVAATKPPSKTALPARSAVQVKASLTAAQEAPPPKVHVTTASGSFTATFEPTPAGYNMVWSLSYSNLSGKASSAYVHQGADGKYGPALFHLCSPCTSGSHGTAYASPSEVALVEGKQTYVNIRTSKNPSGEIRGQLQVG
jgi:hypothetical protein